MDTRAYKVGNYTRLKADGGHLDAAMQIIETSD